jgi:AAA family ATP:ADP antiporter
MATLFFLMAFVNTVLDNLKDTLIFTMAIGGGAQVVPWLTGLVPTMADANS